MIVCESQHSVGGLAAIDALDILEDLCRISQISVCWRLVSSPWPDHITFLTSISPARRCSWGCFRVKIRIYTPMQDLRRVQEPGNMNRCRVAQPAVCANPRKSRRQRRSNAPGPWVGGDTRLVDRRAVLVTQYLITLYAGSVKMNHHPPVA
jgi:hypothetical protein